MLNSPSMVDILSTTEDDETILDSEVIAYEDFGALQDP